MIFEPTISPEKLFRRNQFQKVEILTRPQLYWLPTSTVHGEEGEAEDEGGVLRGHPAQAKPPKNENLVQAKPCKGKTLHRQNPAQAKTPKNEKMK